ncbi:MAG: DAK2 domain-containing protein [Coriobacteriales bacterium]|jgi:DAK2 domain fusion protein YloV|nr:DAK2 domain-containing protein [Coriobacteriales bacterium]
MSAADFIPHILAASRALSDRKDEVNRLNVFPVPDGDTGTNMSLTMETVVSEVQALPPDATTADLRRAVTHGSLMGARGNSGVITSQILRGVCEGIADFERFDAESISHALGNAVEVAFSAVRKPVEGTILTVLRDTAESAHRSAEAGLDGSTALRALSEEAYASVKRTPELLPVLKENGVVDAGGFGLAILIDGFVASITGESAVVWVAPSGAGSEGIYPKVEIEQINDWEGSAYLYCTEFLLHSQTLAVDAAVDFLTSLGDCELLVGSHPDFKVHVHTNEPGTVLSYMTERGQVAEVHIHNMQLQSAERLEKIGRDISEAAVATGTGAESPKPAAGESVNGSADAPPKPLGFIAVASGSGIEKILRSLGVDGIVSGGQTMNPSTKDLLDAINQVNAESVIIFPNNKNIILAATAAVDISEKPAAVVPTKSVPQAFSAMFAVDPECSLEENVEAMTEAIASVRYGEVTTAIKDAKAKGGQKIKNGDTIGIANDEIEVVGSSVDDVALRLIDVLMRDEADTVTLLAGQEYAQADFDALLALVAKHYPDLEIDAHRGEQPLYPLVMALE